MFKHNGILDKYIGDAIMAVFGTPFAGADAMDNSVTAAAEMLHTLGRFNRRRLLEGLNTIDIRLGISIGNICSPRRMDYTVVGHNVNIASRMESANTYYGTQVIITESTRCKLRRNYLLRELDLVRVKGSRTPVAIFEVLDGQDPTEHSRARRLISTFAAGLAHYRKRDWSQTLGCFRKALDLWPGDQPSNLYISRCEHYSESPPAAHWDGIWTMTRK